MEKFNLPAHVINLIDSEKGTKTLCGYLFKYELYLYETEPIYNNVKTFMNVLKQIKFNKENQQISMNLNFLMFDNLDDAKRSFNDLKL